jgi:MFS family permease
VAVGTLINYLDRTVLGIAAPFLTRDLGLDAAEMGLVFSAFSWSYARLQIPGGIFLDRFGTRIPTRRADRGRGVQHRPRRHPPDRGRDRLTGLHAALSRPFGACG